MRTSGFRNVTLDFANKTSELQQQNKGDAMPLRTAASAKHSGNRELARDTPKRLEDEHGIRLTFTSDLLPTMEYRP